MSIYCGYHGDTRFLLSIPNPNRSEEIRRQVLFDAARKYKPDTIRRVE